MRKNEVLTLSLLLLLVPPAVRTLAVADTPDTALHEQWIQWKARYGKTYPSGPSQEAEAHALWLRHWHLVQWHNSRADVTFRLELNAFADQEIKPELPTQESQPLRYAPEVTTDRLPQAPPASFDWRTKGIVSPVRNQGQLGKAGAYAVTEDLESLHAIRTGRLVSLSVQEVADCCPFPFMADVYECIAQHGGLCSEADYPPHGPPDVCRNDSCHSVAQDANKTGHIPKGDEQAMVTAVLKRPLVVFVDAGHTSFQLYESGVYRDSSCTHRLDHALQLVGYGTMHGLPYWILRNPWGSSWGMQGYILIERAVNMCGVADNAIYPE